MDFLEQEVHEIITSAAPGITEANGPAKGADQIVDLLSAEGSKPSAEQLIDEVGGNQFVDGMLRSALL